MRNTRAILCSWRSNASALGNVAREGKALQSSKHKKRNVFNTKYQSDPVLCETFRRSSASWRKRHPDKVRAHNVVKYAIRDGELTIPERCSRCNALDVPQRDGRRSLHAHHKDYAKPLDVEWLCSFCHGNERRKH